MARTLIPVLSLDRFHLFTGNTPAFTSLDVTNGNVSPNDGFTYLEIVSGAGASRTLTIVIPGGVDVDLASPSRVYTLPLNGTYATGVFPVYTYGAELLYNASGSGLQVRPISLRGGV